MTISLRSQTLFAAAVPLLASLVTYWIVKVLKRVEGQFVCREDVWSRDVKCRPACKHGYFSLPGMDHCQPWLECEDLQDVITTREIIGQGAVKMVQKGLWQGYTVAVNTLQNPEFKEDFLHGLNMIQNFQPHQEVVQLIGACDSMYMTQFYQLGSANNLESVLQSEPLKRHNIILTRFNICISYVKTIRFLHSSPLGTRVMCDSNHPNKTLSQFLIGSDLDLVLNDLDALPEANSEQSMLVKCGHQELRGEYVAPEQLWPFDGDFEDSVMPGYDEKSDIWKIPDVCGVILGTKGTSLQLQLFEIHAKCKEEDPSLRPSAAEVANEYEKVLQRINESQDH